MKLLLHCCCGPCSAVVVDHFRNNGDAVTGWFFNPNIHPREERVRREQVFAEAARQVVLEMLPAGPAMGFEEFLLALARQPGARCRTCYRLRLRETAKQAAAEGFDRFSTTLLVSPYQNLAEVSRVGRQAGEQFDVEFMFADLRQNYEESCERAREMGLWRQRYCGCLFSALERAQRRALRAIGKWRKRRASASAAAAPAPRE